MRTNMFLSAATLLCVSLTTEAVSLKYTNLQEDNSFKLPEEFVARLQARDAVTVHPGHVNNSHGENAPRQLVRDVAACGARVTVTPGSSVTFQSTNYPSSYPNRENCFWRFQAADPQDTLTVECSPFNVRGSNSCTRDRLIFGEKVVGRYFQSTRYCGVGFYEPYISFSSTLFVRFRTDRSSTASGFSCEVTVTGEETETTTTAEATTEVVEQTPNPSCACGNVNRATRIVGGQETEVNEYPWQVLLVTRDMYVICGGSIISSQWVLTAAHCVDGGNIGYVLVGDHNFASTDDTTTSRLVEVVQIISHPDYDSSTVDNDMALLRLGEALEFTREVAPVCLPSNPTEDYAGVTATVTGWGATTEGGSMSVTLQEVDVPVLTTAACSSWYSSLTANMMCAGFSNEGKDSCQGDSGGPMVYSATSNYEQIGVVSWGRGCARPGFPGVYARVTEYLEWIAANTGNSGITCNA
uniref:CUB-serine protease n=1 Tax=Panulirus argus TaxID=6737 RepID=Q967X8_PANAR|nr:CUB-serine protease [Panulirus argus]